MSGSMSALIELIVWVAVGLAVLWAMFTLTHATPNSCECITCQCEKSDNQ